MINIQEIVIVNLTGAILFLILPFLRLKSKEYMHFGDYLFNLMSWVSFGALIIEIFTFLIDGRYGVMWRILSYLFNGYLFLASSGVGMLWILFLDYTIYHSLKRLRQHIVPIIIPFLLVAVLVVLDMFGTGNIFYITPDNVYVRGPLVSISYIVMFLYYAYSFILAIIAAKNNAHIPFPLHYFVLPCVFGTLFQGIHYGITIGWFCVSIAFMLIQMQVKNLNAYVDDLSGLYNHQYYNYYIDKIVRSGKCRTLVGIMMDMNHFKSINDQYGHMMGDDAIRNLGNILTRISTEHITAFRLSGDEFAIISDNLSEQETKQLIDSLMKEIDSFNTKNEKPYTISLAIGYVLYDNSEFNSDAFFHQMDKKMYESKSAYYSQHPNNRRRS